MTSVLSDTKGIHAPYGKKMEILNVKVADMVTYSNQRVLKGESFVCIFE
jgi:hypothetical protein